MRGKVPALMRTDAVSHPLRLMAADGEHMMGTWLATHLWPPFGWREVNTNSPRYMWAYRPINIQSSNEPKDGWNTTAASYNIQALVHGVASALRSNDTKRSSCTIWLVVWCDCVNALSWRVVIVNNLDAWHVVCGQTNLVFVISVQARDEPTMAKSRAGWVVVSLCLG